MGSGDPIAKLLGDGGDKAATPGEDAASDFMAAVKAGDSKALHLAFKRMYESCADDEYEDEEDDEEV